MGTVNFGKYVLFDVDAFRAESVDMAESVWLLCNDAVSQKVGEAKMRVLMLEAVGLAEHPKAERCWTIALENGHSGGYPGVFRMLADLAELMLE